MKETVGEMLREETTPQEAVDALSAIPTMRTLPREKNRRLRLEDLFHCETSLTVLTQAAPYGARRFITLRT